MHKLIELNSSKLWFGLLSRNDDSQVEIGAHKDVIRAMTWIVDEAETEGSAAEVNCLNTATTRLCYKCSKDELGEIVVAQHGIRQSSHEAPLPF